MIRKTTSIELCSLRAFARSAGSCASGRAEAWPGGTAMRVQQADRTTGRRRTAGTSFHSAVADGRLIPKKRPRPGAPKKEKKPLEISPAAHTNPLISGRAGESLLKPGIVSLYYQFNYTHATSS